MTDEVREPEVDQDAMVDGADGRPAQPGRRTGMVVAVILAAAFAILAAIVAVVAADLQRQLDDERESTAELDQRSQVATTAGQFSEALLTYRFDDLDASREAVLELSTGAFAQQYESAFSGLSAMIGEARSEARATVKDVFVGGLEEGRAEAITVVDADVEGRSGSRDVLDAYIRLVLVRVDGRWLVDGVTSLNFTPAAATPAGPQGPGGGSDGDG